MIPAKPISTTRLVTRVAVICLMLLLNHSGTFAQERDLDAPHDISNGMDCTSCHVPYGFVPQPVPENWVSDTVCKSCHIEGGTATAADVHLSGDVTVAWCQDCHNPHQHQDGFSRYYLRESIDTPNSGSHELSFNNASDFIHGATGGLRPFDGVCETCHTQTAYHRNTAAGDHSHNAGQSCTDCHTHQNGFKGSCTACHGAPPATGAHLVHFGVDAGLASYGAQANDNHSTAGNYGFSCGVCHPYDSNLHMNGTVDIELSNASAPAGSMKSLSPPTASYTPGSTIFTDSFGIEYTEGSCNNVYCHSEKSVSSPDPISSPLVDPVTNKFIVDEYGNTTYEPYVVTETQVYHNINWGDSGLDCNSCHGTIPRTTFPDVQAGVGTTHSWIDGSGYENLHGWNMSSRFDPLLCRTCHYSTVTDSMSVVRDVNGVSTYSDVAIADKGMHVNGNNDVQFDSVNGVFYNSSYELASASWNAQSKTCQSVSCHLLQLQPQWGKPYRWANECDVCHHYSGQWPQPARSNTHPDFGDQNCLECHLDPHTNSSP